MEYFLTCTNATCWFSTLRATLQKLKDYALKHIPERAGLIVVREKKKLCGGYCKIVRYPKPNRKARKWTEKHRAKLLQLMQIRYWKLKNNLKER